MITPPLTKEDVYLMVWEIYRFDLERALKITYIPYSATNRVMVTIRTEGNIMVSQAGVLHVAALSAEETDSLLFFRCMNTILTVLCDH